MKRGRGVGQFADLRGGGGVDTSMHTMNASATTSQSGIACLKLTIETLEQGVKYAQN